MDDPVIEAVRNDLFRVEVPLPDNPLKATNSYVIRNSQRNLIIDTGMNRKECKAVLLAALEKLKVDLERTDFFITHLHADHVGLAEELPAAQARVFFNRPDAEIMKQKDLWQQALAAAGRHGFPRALLDMAFDAHPGRRYIPNKEVDFTILEEGDSITCGPYQLCCLSTPGHTPGHTCLYEPDQKLLFSGDHVLGDITPNISTMLDEKNLLAQYLSSLDRVSSLAVELVLPGHRSTFTDLYKRIEELKRHHRRRLDEVFAIFKENGPGSAFTAASQMSWDLDTDDWDQFPLMQKWFATGEALAHIRYLERKGLLKRETVDSTIVFSLLSA